MGGRFPDLGLLRYRKWVPQQLGDVIKQESGDSRPMGAQHGNTAGSYLPPEFPLFHGSAARCVVLLCNPIKNIIEMNEAQQRSTSCLKLHYWDIDILHVSIRIPKVLTIFWSNKKNECNSEITQYYYMLERRMVLWQWHRGEQQSFQYWMSRCR